MEQDILCETFLWDTLVETFWLRYFEWDTLSMILEGEILSETLKYEIRNGHFDWDALNDTYWLGHFYEIF